MQRQVLRVFRKSVTIIPSVQQRLTKQASKHGMTIFNPDRLRHSTRSKARITFVAEQVERLLRQNGLFRGRSMGKETLLSYAGCQGNRYIPIGCDRGCDARRDDAVRPEHG